MALFRDTQLVSRDYDRNREITIKGFRTADVAVNPASIATAASGETAVTINGVAVGDIVIANPPASLETGLSYSGCRVSAANTVQLRLSNVTAGAVDGASRTWNFMIIDLT